MLRIALRISTGLIFALLASFLCETSAKAACPKVSAVVTPDDSGYYFYFTSVQVEKIDFKMTFYAAKTEYAADVPTSIFVPHGDEFRSPIIRVDKPDGVALLSVAAAKASGDTCDVLNGLLGEKHGYRNELPLGQELDSLGASEHPQALTLGNPVASAPPTCARPYADARVIGGDGISGIPDVGTTGTVIRASVEVTHGDDGSIVATRMHQSSGFPNFDAATEKAARSYRYGPEIARCKTIGGTYLFEVANGGRT